MPILRTDFRGEVLHIWFTRIWYRSAAILSNQSVQLYYLISLQKSLKYKNLIGWRQESKRADR